MPTYLVTGIVVKNGKPYKAGTQIELSEEIASQLTGHVAPMELADPDKPLDEMTLKELQSVAQAANLEGYSKMRKAELHSALTGIPIPEQAVIDDEPTGD